MKAAVLETKSDLLRRAYDFSEKAHKGQKRKSGEAYFNHCVKTAEQLTEWKLDEATIAAGLLHDVVENTDYTLEDVRQEFGEDIAHLVEGVTKLGTIKYRGEKEQVENLRKLILAMAEDLRVIFIKLADRLHNMKTLRALASATQKRIALETAEIYAPIAYRLGMQRLSGELEDLAFPYIYPDEYKWLLENVKGRYEEREAHLKRIQPVVEKALREADIKVVGMDFRAKRYTSLYKKLLRYEMDLDKIYDLVAFRIVVNSVEDCYATLGVVHNLWTPLPGRVKDYIAMPKPNGYRSLHTTIICTEGKIVEFQIRTAEMHHEVETGIAAHWAYLESKGTKNYLRRHKGPTVSAGEVAWVEQLRAWQKQFTDPQEFIDSLKIDFLKDRIFAITPKGRVIDLPQNATPVDFAYHIHSDIGNQCIGAKVNGKIVPLNYELYSGDVVEIVTQKNKKPSPSWLEFVKTATARGHIREALRKSDFRGIVSPRKREKVEFKITAAHQFGLMKKISSILSRAHVNVLGIDSSASHQRGKFYLIKVRCDINNKDDVLKIILKLKALKDIKEVDYRFV